MAETLLQEPSPHRNLDVVVEAQNSVVYLYLFSPGSDRPITACWVRNLGPAPMSLDLASMKRGDAPMLERAHCRHPDGAPPLDPERLRLVWFEEGDGVALLEDDEPLAIVPVWPGVDFPGYARDCTSEADYCWPLLADNVLRQRVRLADDYWGWWETNPWPTFQRRALEVLEKYLGPDPRYFAIDGDEWPPKAMVIAEREIATVATLGVALRRQPGIDPDDRLTARRIELGFATERGVIDPLAMAQYISGQANLPWANLTFLGNRHTIPCDALSSARTKTKFEFVLLQKDPPDVPSILFDPLRGDLIDLLWLIPITAAERKFAEEKGSGELTKRLSAANAGGVFRDRRDVVQSGVLNFFRR